MNPILEGKLQELENASDYECWYLVKQPTEFDSLCYYVSFLEAYQSSDKAKNLQGYVSDKVAELKAKKPEIVISDNYRALRVAAFFGLIIMTSSKYDEATITPTFREITDRCGGNYENTQTYMDIIQRQIEKMFISSDIDEQKDAVRKEYRLYPVMLLYKVLMELGRSTGSYSLSITEYRYLVATTKRFEGFLDTLLLIDLLRKDTDGANEKFEEYRTKFDNRLILALKQLETLEFTKDTISLKKDKIEEVARKVFIFEENPEVFSTYDYLNFLGSTKSLFELEEFEGNVAESGIDIHEELANDEKDLEKDRVSTGTNVLLYGVPGSGKSWTIEHEYCKKGTEVERLVFHPDYTYSDFVGQILPDVADDGAVTYKFIPGPFTTILRDAYKNNKTEYILVIEEINRGNAPAIFGEVFQLLDRKIEIDKNNDDGFPIGTSEYGITNRNIAKEVYDNPQHKVRIPSNLSIIGTMNTSDQNVFTLDTAFQRRWDMRLIENTFDNVKGPLKNAEILDTGIKWRVFCNTMNEIIVGNNARMSSSEDKRLGTYFVHLSDLEFDPNCKERSENEYNILVDKESAGTLNPQEETRLNEMRKALRQNRKFPEKVIKYLWDDAFKFNREIVFETGQYKSLESIIRAFIYAEKLERLSMFKENVVDMLTNPVE